jgi:transposase
VEKQDLRAWESVYSEEGPRRYHPALLLKVLLYGFALGVRSSRKLEQRVREDLGFRYLAGGAEPDHKTICEFLRRHGRRVNDLFTAVLEQLQAAGLGKLGVVALDSTRVQANASRERVISEAGWRAVRAGKRRQVRKKSGNAAAPISNRYQKETTPKQLNIWKLLARSTAGQSCETDSEALP